MSSDGVHDGDDQYVSRTGQKQAEVPVQSDNDKVEDPIDAEKADTDEQLGWSSFCHSTLKFALLTGRTEKDDNEAIDKSNIVEGRTRGAAKSGGAYREPGDDEGIPTDD